MASLADNVARAIKVFGDIKTAIIERGVSVENNTPVEEYPDKIDQVFGFGREVGYEEGYNSGVDFGYEHGVQQGIQQGRQAQYDEFWDSVQENGNRTNYEYAFCGRITWTKNTFYPKYDIVPKHCSYMFQNCGYFNLKKRLLECNIKIDLSKVTDVSNMFWYGFMNESSIIDCVIPDIFHKGITNATNLFYVAIGVKTIENFTVAENCKVNMAFFRTDSLVNLTIGNTIAANGWDFYWSPKLSHDSIINVIEHLSPTTTGLSIRFLKNNIDTAFETSADLADGSTSDEWTNLVASRSNWTIVLG